MKKLSKKGILLFAGAMALCAFAMPSMASASSWGPLAAPHHVLDSTNIGFRSHILGGIDSACSASSFTFRVLSAADAQITTGAFGGNCTASGTSIGDCTVTTALTGLPWTATAVTTSNIQIHGVDIDLTFENPPLGTCNLIAGQRFRITGTLTGGQWTGNGAGQHQVVFSDDDGLVSHSAIAAGSPITTRGSFTDTQHTLTVTG